jgi:hypothetical protein
MSPKFIEEVEEQSEFTVKRGYSEPPFKYQDSGKIPKPRSNCTDSFVRWSSFNEA